MKKIITLIAISLVVLLTSCGEPEVPVEEIPVDEVLNVEEILNEAIGEETSTGNVIDEDTSTGNVIDEDVLTEDEIDKELEEIFDIDLFILLNLKKS